MVRTSQDRFVMCVKKLHGSDLGQNYVLHLGSEEVWGHAWCNDGHMRWGPSQREWEEDV